MGQTGCPETLLNNYRAALCSIQKQQGLSYTATIGLGLYLIQGTLRYYRERAKLCGTTERSFKVQ